MRQQKSKSNSILRQVFSILLKVGGCLLLVYIGLIAFSTLFFMPLFLSFGIKDKQVEILIGSSATWPINSKQVEGKQYVGSMNKGQEIYYIENSAFGNSVAALGLGFKIEETNNYKYSLRANKTASFHYAVAKYKTLKNYVGAIFIVPDQKLDPNDRRDAMTTTSILCQTDDRPFFRVKRTDEPDETAEPIYQNGEVICGKGTTQVTK